MHVQRHGTENSVGVIDQPHQFAQCRFPPEIQDSLERGMVVSLLAHLHEEDPILEMVHDLLPAPSVPPLDRIVILPARRDDPIRTRPAQGFLDQRRSGLLVLAQVDVPLEFRRPDSQTELFVEVFDESVDEMIGRLVGLVDEGIMAHHRPDLRILRVEGREVRVVLPQRRAGSPDIREETSGVRAVQVAKGGREHHNVPGRQPVFEDPLLLFHVWDRCMDASMQGLCDRLAGAPGGRRPTCMYFRKNG